MWYRYTTSRCWPRLKIEHNKAFLYYNVFSSYANLWCRYPTSGSWLLLMIEDNKELLYFNVLSSNANLWYQYPTLGSWLRLIAASKSVRSSSIWDNPTLATTSLPFITEVVNSFVYSAAGRLERKQFQSYQYLLHLCEMIRKSCTNLKNSFHR